MGEYVALLRGINLGGKRMKMEELRQVFGDLGFSKVSTLLASGNVVFESEQKDPDQMRERIEAAIEASFGFSSRVIVRSAREIAELVAAKPFAGVEGGKDARLHISFLAEAASGGPKIPYRSPDGVYQIVKAGPGYLAGVVFPSPGSGTPDYMDFLSRQYGDDVTTRTWNTVLKIHAHMQQDE
jgi:uncharacterized protein (DUF1697 family)